MRWLCNFWMHLELMSEEDWTQTQVKHQEIFQGNIQGALLPPRKLLSCVKSRWVSLGWIVCDLKGCSLLRVALSFLHVKDSESKTLQSLSSDQIVIKSMTQWRLASCPRSVDRPLCYVRNSYVLIQCNPNVFSLYFIPLCKHVFSIAANVSTIICFNL